jgi:hypothetical protein
MFRFGFALGVLGLGLASICAWKEGSRDAFVLLEPSAKQLIVAGQIWPGGLPPGPGGPCANGVSYTCESGTSPCNQKPCTVDPVSGDVVCYINPASPEIYKQQNYQGWLACSFGWPSGWNNCDPFTWYCTTSITCARTPCYEFTPGNPMCVNDPNSNPTNTDPHNGGVLNGGAC